MKRITALLLALLVVLTMVPAMAEGEQEVVTLKVGFSTHTDVDNWLKYSNEVRILREEYGIEVDAKCYDDEQIGLMLASEELPDVMTIWKKYYDTIIDNKLALDLTPYIGNELSNFDNDIFASGIALSKELLGGEEKALYLLPNCIGDEGAAGGSTLNRGYVVRWDLYKQLGCPEINSDDDFINILEQMVALEPTTANGDTVYAMGCSGESMTWWNLRGGFIRDTASVCFWTSTPYLYQASYEDGQLYDGYTDMAHSAYWTDMRFFNKLYNKGLFDPDSFIMTRDEYNAKATAGQYIAIGPSTAGDKYYNTALQAEGADTLKGLVVVPSKNAVLNSSSTNDVKMPYMANTNGIFISAKTDKLETALRYLNITRDPEFVMMCYNGEKGVDWDYDENGVPHYTEKWYADKEKYIGTEYLENTGIYGRIAEFTGFNNGMLAPYGGYYDLKQNTENVAKTQTALQADFAAYYGFETMYEVYVNAIETGLTISNQLYANAHPQGPVSSLMEAIPDDIQRILNDANDIMFRAIPELVMAESEDDFNAIQARVLSDLESIDEPAAWAWYSEARQAAVDVLTNVM